MNVNKLQQVSNYIRDNYNDILETSDMIEMSPTFSDGLHPQPFDSVAPNTSHKNIKELLNINENAGPSSPIVDLKLASRLQPALNSNSSVVFKKSSLPQSRSRSTSKRPTSGIVFNKRGLNNFRQNKMSISKTRNKRNIDFEVSGINQTSEMPVSIGMKPQMFYHSKSKKNSIEGDVDVLKS